VAWRKSASASSSGMCSRSQWQRGLWHRPMQAAFARLGEGAGAAVRLGSSVWMCGTRFGCKTAALASAADGEERRLKRAIERTNEPGGERPVALLLPYPRPWVILEQHVAPSRRRWRRTESVNVDAAEVLGALVAVLRRADQANRCTMVAVEGPTVEPVGDEHLVGERILDQGEAAVAVEPTEAEVGHDGRESAPAR
jgi:hypothetical protein